MVNSAHVYYFRLLSAYKDRICNYETYQHRYHVAKIFSTALNRKYRLKETPTLEDFLQYVIGEPQQEKLQHFSIFLKKKINNILLHNSYFENE